MNFEMLSNSRCVCSIKPSHSQWRPINIGNDVGIKRTAQGNADLIFVNITVQGSANSNDYASRRGYTFPTSICAFELWSFLFAVRLMMRSRGTVCGFLFADCPWWNHQLTLIPSRECRMVYRPQWSVILRVNGILKRTPAALRTCLLCTVHGIFYEAFPNSCCLPLRSSPSNFSSHLFPWCQPDYLLWLHPHADQRMTSRFGLALSRSSVFLDQNLIPWRMCSVRWINSSIYNVHRRFGWLCADGNMPTFGDTPVPPGDSLPCAALGSFFFFQELFLPFSARENQGVLPSLG